MARSVRTFLFIALAMLLVPVVAGAIVEPGTKMEYPDLVTVTVGDQSHNLKATGVGLREKTFMKVNVYTIASYVSENAELTGDKGVCLLGLDSPKQLRMDLLRGFSREKLVNSFKEVIEQNYEDTAPFAANMEDFFAYFTADAQEKDILVFTYLPGQGLTTTLNGQEKGVITNPAFVSALWTVWFGKKPASDGLKRDLLSAL
jgi:hypothetical protein